MLKVNFYEELEIDSTASLEDIKKCIKSTRRRYRSLTGSPNIDQRSMAERKMVILSEAEKIFENEESRKKYDDELGNMPDNKEDSSTQAVDGANADDEYINRSRSAYEVGNLKLAVQYAREATQSNRNNLEAWKLRATIAKEIHQLDEAEMACTEASYIRPNDSEIMGLMGDIHYDQRNYSQATKDYENAFQLSKNYYWQYQKALSLYKYGNIVSAAELFEKTADEFDDLSAKATLLKLAATSYEEVGKNTKSKELLHRVIGLEPTLQNKLAYAMALGHKERKSYSEELFQSDGSNNLVQELYVESLISDLISENGNERELKIDSKEKSRNVKSVVSQLNTAHLTSPSAIRRQNELAELSKYASKRHLQKSGCGTIVWLVILFNLAQWFITLILGSFLGTVAAIAVVLGYVSYFVYPEGWLITKRGG